MSWGEYLGFLLFLFVVAGSLFFIAKYLLIDSAPSAPEEGAKVEKVEADKGRSHISILDNDNLLTHIYTHKELKELEGQSVDPTGTPKLLDHSYTPKGTDVVPTAEEYLKGRARVRKYNQVMVKELALAELPSVQKQLDKALSKGDTTIYLHADHTDAVYKHAEQYTKRNEVQWDYRIPYDVLDHIIEIYKEKGYTAKYQPWEVGGSWGSSEYWTVSIPEELKEKYNDRI